MAAVDTDFSERRDTENNLKPYENDHWCRVNDKQKFVSYGKHLWGRLDCVMDARREERSDLRTHR